MNLTGGPDAPSVTIDLPRKIGGAVQDHSDSADQAVAQIEGDTVAAGWNAEVAMYTDGRGTNFIVLVGPRPPVAALDYQLKMMDKEVQAQGFRIVFAQKQRSKVNGAEFLCAPVTGEISESVCLWIDDHRMGMVIGYLLGVDRTQGLAVRAQRLIAG
jgi:hypothetical protein